MEGPGFIIGNIAKGGDLWDRKAEIARLWRILEKGSALLKAPRRFGKSSIMYHLFENPQEEYKTFFLDTEGMNEPQDFISALATSLLSDSKIRKSISRLGDFLKGIVDRIEEVGYADARLKIRAEIGDEWRDRGLELIRKLSGKEKILFLIDELPVLAQRIARKGGNDIAGDFLHWFRALRQTPELAGVRWVLGGSIGIEHVLDDIGVGSKVINDFETVRIGPFTDDDARQYISALLRNEGGLEHLDPTITDEILLLLGAPVPYFIQILVKESLYEMQRSGGATLTAAMIRKAYQEEVLGPASRTYFDHYFTRLKDYYDPQRERIAKRLILEVARTGETPKSALFRLFRQVSEGQLGDESFSYLMTDIENDFYVAYQPEPQTYRFSTHILRDWWLRYYDLVEE